MKNLQAIELLHKALRSICLPVSPEDFAPRKELKELTQEDLDKQWELLNQLTKILNKESE